MKRIIILVALVMVSCLSACSATSNSPETQTVIPTKEVSPVPKGPDVLPEAADPEPATLTEQEKAKRIPVRIMIPTFDVNAPIEPVGLDNEGRVGTVPNAETVGWYKYGPAPGAEGNAILDGHRDWGGKLGSLRPIERLKLGEAVTIVFEDGSKQTFKVVSNNIYPLDDVPEDVMNLKGEARLTLVTCSGKYVKAKGGYQSRVVVVLK